jgi:hypothetical protein
VDDLPEVRVDRSSFGNRPDDRGEVVVGQDDIRRLARHIRTAAPHRDPDVCTGQSRRVIDAISRHRDNVAFRL